MHQPAQLDRRRGSTIRRTLLGVALLVALVGSGVVAQGAAASEAYVCTAHDGKPLKCWKE